MNFRYALALTFLFSLATGYLLAGATDHAGMITPSLEAASAPATELLRDTLPMGRYQMSTFRNGESFEFRVTDGVIEEIKVNGEAVAKEDYDKYRGRIAQMITGETHADPFRFFTEDDGRTESFQQRMEMFGERWEAFGEELGESMENMFRFEEHDGILLFEFDGEPKTLQLNLDSLMEDAFPDSDRRFHFEGLGEGEEYDLEELIEEKRRMTEEREREIEEMETMIDRLERRKAERAAEPITVRPLDMDEVIDLLRAEDLLGNETVRSVDLTRKRLLINGKPTSPKAGKRAWELYAEQGRNFAEGFRYERDGVSW